jgi:hypothetical protein
MQDADKLTPAEAIEEAAVLLELTGEPVEMWPTDVYAPDDAYVAELATEAGKRGLTLDVGPWGGWLTRPE